MLVKQLFADSWNTPLPLLRFRAFLRAFFSIGVMLAMQPLHAEPWAPEPNVAADTGNWSSATFQELQIRLNGFRGYETTRVLGIDVAKLHHPQHIVRLPNKAGADGKMRAYFAITHSNRFYREAKAAFYTDGYWIVAEIDADAYNATTDQVFDTPGSDGQYVYEEHFNDDRDEARKEYADELAEKGSQMKISLVGDWAHPAKMTAFGGILVMVGQNWSPLDSAGDSLDAVLFYDVRDPVHPVFLGMFDSADLGIPGGTIDQVGLAKSPNGNYHLGVQGKNFFCHESKDCFISPRTAGKWTPEDTGPGIDSFRMSGGQGDIFQSLENFGSVPAADETCYDHEGNRYLGGEPRPAECMPAGEPRIMWFEPLEDSVLPNDFSASCDWFGEECNQGNQNKMGIPFFQTLKYDSSPYLASETGFEVTNHFAGKYSSGPKNEFLTQLWGDCSPSAGIHVNNNKVPLIYCISESANEPIDCPGETGECNRIWQNAASAAPSYGAIKLTALSGQSAVYRGRGLRNIADLAEPPWGPGKGRMGAVDWASKPITEIEVVSGEWLIYGTTDFNGGPVYHFGKGKHAWDSSVPLGSFRVVPERGISLFEHGTYTGRMVNNVDSNPVLTHLCGDNLEICYSYERENDCNIFGSNCEQPRTFNDEATSLIVSDGVWGIFQHDGYGGQSLVNLDKKNAAVGEISSLSKWGMNDVVTSVQLQSDCEGGPATPTSLEYTLPAPGRPLLTWSYDNNTDYYEVDELIGNKVVSTQVRATNRFMPYSTLEPGVYQFRVRGIKRETATCNQQTGADSEVLSVIIPKVPVLLEIDATSTDAAGLGSGSVTVKEAPASQVGGIFYVPGETVTMTAIPADRAEFDRWGGDASACGTTAVCPLVITEGSGMKVQAMFRPKPVLVVLAVGGGTRDGDGETVDGGTIAIGPEGSPCSNVGYTCFIYSTGDEVTLTAAPREGAAFAGWRGDDDCADGSVTMNGDRRCEALFKYTSHQLTVARSPGVHVVSAPAGEISCGNESDCEETYQVSDGEKTVALQAVLDPDYVFVRWSGLYDCWDEDEADDDPLTASVLVGANEVDCSVIAVPADTNYALTIEKRGGGTVTALASPGADSSGIDCPLNACSQHYVVNTVVQLTARATGGSEFVGFESPDAGSDDYSRDDDDCIDGEINMVENVSCVASFKTNVLVVNGDDDSRSKEQNPYVSVLRNMDLVDFDIWHIQNPNSGDNSTDPATGKRRVEPSAEDLAKYGRIIWYTGSATADPATFSPAAGPGPVAEAALAEYLDNGGCLLMSSPQYYKDRGLTAFMQTYLGVGEITEEDVEESYVKGAGSPSLGFSELTADSLAGTASEGYFPISENSGFISDAIGQNPAVAGSDVLFTYREKHGTAAVAVDNGIYRTVFLGFPFLGIPSGESQNNTMRAFLDFCGKPDTDDLFEVNDDFDGAVVRAGTVNLGALKILAGNDDYFKWESDWYADTRFQISFKHAKGDLAIELYDSERKLIGSSQTSEDEEEILVKAVDAGETYYLRVFGVDDASSPYKLTIAAASASDRDHDGVADVDDALPDDPLEQHDADRDLIGDNADPDDDNDLMPDSYELEKGFDPLLAATPYDDADGDGFSDVEEYLAGSDPRDPKSTPLELPPAEVVVEEDTDFDDDGIDDVVDLDDDNDGIPDEFELENSLDPLNPDDAAQDYDNDGTSNLEEYLAGTDPNDGVDLRITMNAGLNDAWYNRDTTGQGFFITVFPKIGYVSLAWFTYDTRRPGDSVAANLGEPGHRWLSALGKYSVNQAVMDITFTSGGLFDTPTEVTDVKDGNIVLTFADCRNGTVKYDIPSIDRRGTVPIQRVVGDNIALCETLARPIATPQTANRLGVDGSSGTSAGVRVTAQETPALVDMNAGLNDAWYYPLTTGQGFFTTVFPKLGYVSLSWFTYDTERPGDNVTSILGEPGHRWLSALGKYSGNRAVMDISVTSGGLFDNPTGVTEVKDGTIVLTFSDCENGTVEYDIPSIDQQGNVPIQRVVGDNIALCESLIPD